MAHTATKATAEVAAAVKTTKATVAASAPAIDWDDLAASVPDATVVKYTRTTGQVDRETSTPEFVKGRVTAAYALTAAASNGKPVSQFQILPTVAAAEAFLKLGKLYASFSSMTMRGKVLSDAEVARAVELGNLPVNLKATVPVVSYTVKAKETKRK